MNPWIRIMRPFNCFLLSMCVIVGMIADQGLDTFSHWPAMIMAFIGAWSLSAAAMIINDYFDRKIDDINQPERSIPAGEIKANIALMVGIILVVIGILMSVGIDLYEKIAQDGVFGVSLVTGIISAILLFSYTNYLKRYSLLGNFAVSICVWFGFTYGDLVFDFQLNIFPECLGFSAFVLNFGREIAKGIIDIEGDKEYNVTTVATVLGKRWTAIISAIFYILAISTTVIPIVLAGASWLYLSTILISDILAIIVTIWILIDQSAKSIIKIKTIILYIMLISLISFASEALFGELIGPIIS